MLSAPSCCDDRYSSLRTFFWATEFACWPSQLIDNVFVKFGEALGPSFLFLVSLASKKNESIIEDNKTHTRRIGGKKCSNTVINC